MNQSLPNADQEHLRETEDIAITGDVLKARRKLAEVSPRFANHPEVLWIHYKVCEVEEDWSACLKIANDLIQVNPVDSTGWLCRAEAFFELERPEDAKETLLSVSEDFSDVASVFCVLADSCVACGKLKEARRWIKKAFEISPWEAAVLLETSEWIERSLWEDLEPEE